MFPRFRMIGIDKLQNISFGSFPAEGSKLKVL